MTTIEENIDTVLEYKALNKLLAVENRDWINRLSPALFTGIRQEILRAMQLAFTQYGTITYEGIHQYMKGNVPGELTAAVKGDLDTLVTQLVRLAKKRQLIRQAQVLSNLSNEYDPSMAEIETALEFEPVMTEQDSSLLTGAQAMLGNLHAKMSGDYIFAKTGFKFLNRNMGNEWKPKGLIVIAGGVGSGKTTLWMNSQLKMAEGYVNKHGEIIQTPSLFISLEMSKEDLMIKLAANKLNINSNDILSGDFDTTLMESDKWETPQDVIRAIEDEMVNLQRLPMYVVDNGSLTLAQIVYEIRKHVHKYNARVVCIDYMQLINHSPTGNKNNDLGELARVLKELAKRENITIIILSQINRSGEGVDAIRDSGEVQAVVDVIVQILPESDEDSLSNATSMKNVNIAWLKNRYGPAGRKTPLLFNGSYQRFEEG